MITIDKETFIKYEQVRTSHEYDVIFEWQKVKEIINVTPDEYWYIIDNWKDLFDSFSINVEMHTQGLNRGLRKKQ